jgi:microcystin-dependent protein
MADAYIGEIMQVAFNYAPRNWALCQGQQVAVSQNQALFALVGTLYGGNGVSTFGLPDSRGRAFIGWGQSNTGTNYVIGQMAGTESTTLTTANMPAHNHSAVFTPSGGGPIAVTGSLQACLLPPPQRKTSETAVPADGSMLGVATDASSVGASPVIYVPSGTTGTAVNLAGLSLNATGGLTGGTVTTGINGSNVPFSTMQPYVAVSTCICLYGIYPSRN